MIPQTQRELPRYKCHKEVWALKIKSIDLLKWPPCNAPIGLTTCGYGPLERMHTGSTDPIVPPAGRHAYRPTPGPVWDKLCEVPADIGGFIYPEDESYGPYPVSQLYLNKHKPQPGGYLVVYKDGYESFSPSKAFEEGYSRV